MMNDELVNGDWLRVGELVLGSVAQDGAAVKQEGEKRGVFMI